MRNIITKEQLKNLAPAVFSDKSVGTSDKYVFVSTIKLIDDFEKLGWYPVFTQNVKARKGTGIYGKHLIRFAHISNLNSTEELIPEIVWINSHNRTSKAILGLGMYRSVCGNGLIVSQYEFGSFNKRHMYFTFEELEEAVNQLTSDYTKLLDKIKAYQQVYLTNGQKHNFANTAIQMIYNENAHKYEADNFLAPQRLEDESNDIFTIMNIVQEWLLKGGVKYLTKKGERYSRVIRSIDRTIFVTTVLWNLMEQFVSDINV
jgi:hypothetical protein